MDIIERLHDRGDHYIAQHAMDTMDAAAAAIEKLCAALTEARAWFLLPENIDLNGSDRVYRMVDDALGTVYKKNDDRTAGPLNSPLS